MRAKQRHILFRQTDQGSHQTGNSETSDPSGRKQSDSVLLCLQATMLVELLCLLVFTVRLVHYARVIPRDKFWKDPKNICIIVILTVGGTYAHHSGGSQNRGGVKE